MSPPTITVKYDQLATLASQFGQLATSNEELTKRISQCSHQLLAEGWEGRGAQAFANELQERILPAFQRLSAILHESQAVTQAMSTHFHEAEDKAAVLFKGEHEAGSSSESGVEWATTGTFDKQFGSLHVTGRTATKGFNYGWHSGDGTATIGIDNKGKIDLGFKYNVWGGQILGKGVEGKTNIAGHNAQGSASIKFGAIEAGGGAEVGSNKLRVGVGGEFAAVEAEAEGVVGSTDAGLTGGIKGKLLGLDGFAGVGKDGLGAKAGFTAASIEGDVGANIAGFNVSVGLEAGLKWEWGIKWGPKGEAAVGPFSLTFSFGKAKDGKLH